MSSRRHVLLVALAGLAVADASVVTLALPTIVVELGASVEQVAAVLAVYTLTLAIALPAAEAVRRRYGSPALVAGGAALFAAGSLACGLAPSVGVLLAFRAPQAIGAAAVLVAAFELLDAGTRGRSAWTFAAVFAAAAGPALGGALTELLDWRAIFLVQAPVAAIGAVLLPTVATPRPTAPLEPSRPLDYRAATALALVSAALTGVLFLLVLLLVSGWSLSPLAAAAAVSVLPLAALAGARIPGHPRTRAAAGAALLGAGVSALAFVPTASVAWTLGPQLMAGLGMGLALTALSGELLPERTPAEAARLLSIRHAGITLLLVALAPLAASQLDESVERTQERGAAIVLDAGLPPLDKLGLVEAILADIDPADPRGGLQEALDQRVDAGSKQRLETADVVARTDESLVAGVREAFAPTFLVCGALALIGALALLPPPGRGRSMAIAWILVAAATVPAAAFAGATLAPEPVRIADPCEQRALPSTGGIDGLTQDVVLLGLDRTACRFGSSREELALALVDDAAAARFEDEHGVDPRSASELLRGVTGF